MKLLPLSAAVLLVVLGGCSSDKTSDTATEPYESATPTEQPALALGDEVDLTVAKVTVFEYRKDIPDQGSPPDRGLRLDALLVKVCNVDFDEETGDGALGRLTDPFNFSLIDAEDGTYDLYDLTPSPAPQPTFADFKVLDKGACTKGWMAFDLPDDTKPIRVTFGADNDEAAEWTLP